jgi:hypothetical protein
MSGGRLHGGTKTPAGGKSVAEQGA